jgi:hypothetical protein
VLNLLLAYGTMMEVLEPIYMWLKSKKRIKYDQKNSRKS